MSGAKWHRNAARVRLPNTPPSPSMWPARLGTQNPKYTPEGKFNLSALLPTGNARDDGRADLLLESLARLARRVVWELGLEEQQTVERLGGPRQLVEAARQPEVCLHVVAVELQRRHAVAQRRINVAVPIGGKSTSTRNCSSIYVQS